MSDRKRPEIRDTNKEQRAANAERAAARRRQVDESGPSTTDTSKTLPRPGEGGEQISTTVRGVGGARPPDPGVLGLEDEEPGTVEQRLDAVEAQLERCVDAMADEIRANTRVEQKLDRLLEGMEQVGELVRKDVASRPNALDPNPDPAFAQPVGRPKGDG